MKEAFYVFFARNPGIYWGILVSILLVNFWSFSPQVTSQGHFILGLLDLDGMALCMLWPEIKKRQKNETTKS